MITWYVILLFNNTKSSLFSILTMENWEWWKRLDNYPRNNLIALPLTVCHIAGMVDDDMARLSQSVMTYCLLYRDDGGSVRSLGLVGVERRLFGALGGWMARSCRLEEEQQLDEYTYFMSQHINTMRQKKSQNTKMRRMSVHQVRQSNCIKEL